MSKKIRELLNNQVENHIAPFFWLHGESEAVLRDYMKVIYEANIRAVCVESRPHPDFLGEGWWKDMDIILDEARNRGMRVWILDDSHFPTGYCNGMIEKKPVSFRRQFLTYKILGIYTERKEQRWSTEDCASVLEFTPSWIEEYFQMSFEKIEDDRWLGAVAVKKNGASEDDLIILDVIDNEVIFNVPEGVWTVYSCQLTRNRGPHRSYMNMLDKASCRTLIDTVYEPHYEHYRKDFGNTIAGFFSDEPEIGNGHLYQMDQKIFEMEDQPWSEELQERLEGIWGKDYIKNLPLLWDQTFDNGMTAKVRYTYLDQVTRCVEEDFSMQIGDWCHEHNVEYIGHLIEDNNQHARCGSSLGHFFRGLAGQDMSGIDDIGGQVIPQGEDIEFTSHLGTKRDGSFYHFALARLASSAAAIDPKKSNRALCEIFGNYGWEEGVRLEAYLADHFMVRGINYFVPHAFSAKAFPDQDCPPHFYAHGHNPQYRHFGELMKYMNRVCNLISDGIHESEAAILYHSDAEWTGMKCMYIQDVSRILTETQCGFDFVPSDIFTDDYYGVNLKDGFKINTQSYNIFIVPEADYISKETAEAVISLVKQNFPCVFVNNYPVGICSQIKKDYEQRLIEEISNLAEVVTLDELARYIEQKQIARVQISPKEEYIRSYLYYGETDILYLVNEGVLPYEGNVFLKNEYTSCYRYEAWANYVEAVDYVKHDEGIEIKVNIEPGKSLIIVFEEKDTSGTRVKGYGELVRYRKLDIEWKRSVCQSIYYPDFHDEVHVQLPDAVEKELPNFAGIVRYEKKINLTEAELHNDDSEYILEITDAGETVQVFVNEIDMGIQIVPPFRYRVSAVLEAGENRIAIEVATTLERQIPPKNKQKEWIPQNKMGLCGEVYLCKQ